MAEEITKKKRKNFNLQSILKRLVDVKPVCVKCGRTALQRELNLHHKDGEIQVMITGEIL